MGRILPPPTSSAEPLVQGAVTLLTAECIIRQLATPEGPGSDGAAQGLANFAQECSFSPASPSDRVTSPVVAGWSTVDTRLTRGLDMPARVWDDLFRAVQVRLSQAVVGVGEDLPDDLQLEIAATTQRIVIECMAALDSLHSSLTHERDLQEQFEIAVFHAQGDLAKALGAIAVSSKSRMRNGSRRTTTSSAPKTPAHRPVTLSHAPLYGALVTARTQREAQRSHTRAQAVRSAE